MPKELESLSRRDTKKPITFAAKKKAALANLTLTHALIKRYGWIQDAEGDINRGFCLIGAAHEADGWGEVLAWRTLEDLVENDSLRGKIDAEVGGDPVTFNDMNDTTKQDVLKLVRRGIKAITECKKIYKSRHGERFQIKLVPLPEDSIGSRND
jgi:hypothetical protein